MASKSSFTIDNTDQWTVYNTEQWVTLEIISCKSSFTTDNTDQWSILDSEQWWVCESEVIVITKYFILKGLSNNFSAVWAEPTTRLTSGKLFIGGVNTFCVIDLSRAALVDYYSTTISGRAGKALVASDLIDLNAV